MFHHNFESLKTRKYDLFPAEFKQQIEEVADGWIYNNILNGVYKTGFAGNDEAYE